MGTLCCCPVPENLEEIISYPNGALYQRCTCLQTCVRWFLHMYSSLFERFGGGELTTNQTSASSAMVTRSSEPSLMDTYRAPPRPLPYDADARYLRLARDGLVSRREKLGMGHLFSGESRTSGDGEAVALLPRQGAAAAATAADPADEQAQDSDALGKPSKFLPKSESMQSLIDDEDVCPTCLDVYTTDNPKINTECGHHFHLACILEWMERSKHCPVCDKDMVFHENAGA